MTVKPIDVLDADTLAMITAWVKDHPDQAAAEIMRYRKVMVRLKNLGEEADAALSMVRK